LEEEKVLGPSTRNRRPLWFDDEDRERILARAREWLDSICNDVAALFEEFPQQNKEAAIKSALNLLDLELSNGSGLKTGGLE
jgi:hypothetical protein